MARVSNLKVRQVDTDPRLRQGLSSPRENWLESNPIDSERIRSEVEQNAPLSSNEIADWMHDATVDAITLRAMQDDYDKAGSKVDTDTDDGYIPGTNISNDFNFKSEKATVVGDRGYVVLNTPNGTVNLSEGQAVTLLSKDFIGWANARDFGGVFQWVASLIDWRELASRPTDNAIRHPIIGGHTVPQFVMVNSNGILRNTVMVTTTSSEAQTLSVKGLNPNNFQKEMFTFNIDIPEGESQWSYNILGPPNQTSHVMYVQPEDGVETVLKEVK